MLALLRAIYTPGAVARLPNRRGVHAWELVHAPLPGPAPAIVAYRSKIGALVDWCRANHPRQGWARRQSRQRARRHKYATEFNLPARSRPAFYSYRRAVRGIARLLAVLDLWWDRLCPAQRSPAPRYEEPGSASDKEHYRSLTESRTQRPRSIGELLGEAGPEPAM
jgi:hypothetical protein